MRQLVFAQVLCFLFGLICVSSHVYMQCVYICVYQEQMLNLVTAWIRGYKKVAATSPLSGYWIQQLLTGSNQC